MVLPLGTDYFWHILNGCVLYVSRPKPEKGFEDYEQKIQFY
jgi:hypothetical protein